MLIMSDLLLMTRAQEAASRRGIDMSNLVGRRVDAG